MIEEPVRGGYVSLESIVYLAIDEEDKGEDIYRKALNFAVSGYREMNMDVTGDTGVAVMNVMANKICKLPVNYSNWVTIGVMNDKGILATLSSNDEISLANVIAPDRFGDNPVQYDTTDNSVFDQPRDVIFPYQTLGSLGIGSLVNLGDFRVDKRQGIIVFGPDFSYSQVIMEYKQDANVVTDGFLIDSYAEKAILAYIQWRLNWRRKDVGLTEKENLRQEYYNQKRLAKRRMNPVRLQDMNDSYRRNVKSAPKA